MAAGRNVIGILGPAATVGLGFFVPTVFLGVQPTPDTTTQIRSAYLSPPFKFRNNQVDASQGLNLCLTPAVATSTPRTPVLSPPFKFRISQSDASQPLNIALTTVVANPFTPVDFSKPYFPVVRVDPPLGTNVNLFTNPVPFGPFDYNISHDVISSPPQAVPYNINIFVNPIPFGPYDWTARPPQMPARAPDQIERNPNIFSEVPLRPFDYNIAHRVVSSPPQPQPYNVNIFTNPIPFGPYDWSKPFYPIARVDPPLGTNPNLFTNPIPFGPYDWSAKPSQYPPRAPDQIYYNIVLNVAPAANPFLPLDWSKPFFPVARVDQVYPNLALAPTPFIPFDWSKPFFPSIRIDQTQPTNINLFTNPIPFGPYDWSARPQQYSPRAPDQIYKNIALVPTPFVPIDWSKPFFPTPSRDTTQPTNINLFTNPIPLGPYDWSARPNQFPPRAPDQIYYNISLNVTPAPPTPFAQYDWSKPFFPRVLKENAPQTNPNLFPNPIPFGPYDLSYRPSQYPPRAPDVFHRNPLIFSEVPLIPRDFSRPVRVTAPPLLVQPYNVTLYQPPPLRSIDFSTARQLPGLPPPPQPYAINLLTPTGPAPFLNIDWSKPFAVRPVPPQALANLTITLPPPPLTLVPIIPFDWSKPWRIIPVPPQTQSNLTLLLPAPGLPGLAFSVDFAVYKAKPELLLLYTSTARDVSVYQVKPFDLRVDLATDTDV